MDEYVDIKDIGVEIEREESDDELCKVYQIQPYEGGCCFMEVGVAAQLFDTVVTDFKYRGKDYVIISCLYNKEKIDKLGNGCIYPIFKISLDNNRFISYNLNVFSHKVSGGKLIDFLSTDRNKIKLNGFFTTTLCDGTRYIILDKGSTFKKGEDGIKKLIQFLPKTVDMVLS